MTSCPNCSQFLTRKQSEFGVFWACEGCNRWLIGLPILRRTVETAFFNRLWQEVRTSGGKVGTPCPTCSKPMNQLSLETPNGSMNPLVCPACNVAWLTLEERAALPIQAAPKPAQPEPPPPENQLPKEAAQMLALHKVEVIAENAKRANQLDATHLPMWQKLLASFGFPVEDTWEEGLGIPWVTMAVVLITTATSIYFFSDYTASVKAYGFIPVEYDRMGGLTFLTCFLIHGGWMHLIGNMYFLFTFGRGVEDKIGGLGILILLALSTIGGCLFTLCFNPDSDIPNIGASGGIAGVLLFYGFAFPKRKLVFMMTVQIFPMFRLIRLPALAVLALWVGIQVLGVFGQRNSGVSYSGHLGGLLVGFAFWLLWRWKNSGGLIKVEESK